MSKTCQGIGWASGNMILAKEKYFLKQKIIQVYAKTCKTAEHKIKLQSKIT